MCELLGGGGSSVAWTEIINVTNTTLLQRDSGPTRSHAHNSSSIRIIILDELLQFLADDVTLLQWRSRLEKRFHLWIHLFKFPAIKQKSDEPLIKRKKINIGWEELTSENDSKWVWIFYESDVGFIVPEILIAINSHHPHVIAADLSPPSSVYFLQN